MTSRFLFAFPLACLIALLAAPAARADDAPLKIAICNPIKILGQIQEAKDLAEKAKQDRAGLETQFKERKEKIASLQDELKLILPSSDQYDKKNQELLQASIETDVWAKMMDANLGRKIKNNNKAIFEKIQTAIAQVAHDKGITLVISDQHQDLPDNLDNVDLNTVNAILLQRSILFSDPKLDITQDVVIAMDKTYSTSH